MFTAGQVADWAGIFEKGARERRLDVLVLSELGRGACPKFEGMTGFPALPSVGRSVRGAGRGQGLCVYVRDRLLPFFSLAKATQHCVWLRFAPPGYTPLFLGGVYVPPASSPAWQRPDGGQDEGWQDMLAGLQADVQQFSVCGQVCMLGDFNAHTGVLDESGDAGAALLDDLGTMGHAGVQAVSLPRRANSDSRPACLMGKALVRMCEVAGCVVLNGRAPGDEWGAPTRYPTAPGQQPSVIDYGIVSRALFPLVERFAVTGGPGAYVRDTSDHCILQCILGLPREQRARAAGRALPLGVRWDPSKREQFRDRLHGAECERQRTRVVQAMQSGLLSVEAASEQWCAVVQGVALAVFGGAPRAGRGPRGTHGGRMAKAWFKECVEEYRALQAALRDGDHAAVAAARRCFNAKKRAVQRRHEREAEGQWRRDIKHNPRRFWTRYAAPRQDGVVHDMAALTQHWQSLLAPSGSGGLQEAAASVPDLVAALQAGPGQAGDAAPAAAAMNGQFDVDEVVSAVRRLQYGRMAGPDNLKGELLRGLYDVEPVHDPESDRWYERHVYRTAPGSVMHDLCCILNAAFSAGTVPTAWCAAYVSAVHKRGDPAALDNYRGIAVGGVLGKLFSLALHARLSGWSEATGRRAEGQAGFRDGRRTSDHVFVLKHLVDRVRAKRGQRLWACFVDFTKAYDLVRRDLLLRCLADMGVHGNMLSAIASMYWEAPVAVKSGLQFGDFFGTTQGVKQGDPLSPLLFGLFIDRVEEWLHERASECGVQLGERLVRVLLYADDLVLLANSPRQLQQLLDALHAFCAENCMHVNVAKSAVVVFGKSKPRCADVPAGGWLYAGQPLPLLPEFRYLGVCFHQTRGVTAALEHLRAAGLRAMWGMLGRCTAVGMRTLSLQAELFGYIVAPVLNFCSEVWGPTVLKGCGQPADCLGDALHRVQTLFVRRLAGGLRKATPRLPMLREFGVAPLARAWVQSSVCMWQRVCGLPAGSLLGDAMRENLALDSDQSWAHGFHSLLSTLELLPAGGLVQEGRLRQVCARGAVAAFDAWFERGWQGLPVNPRTAERGSVIACTYARWFAVPAGAEATVPGYVASTAGMPAQCVRSLAAFRLGAHDLEVATGRWHGQERGERLCRLCQSGVGDEFHMVFECPAYAAVRQCHAVLFEPCGGLQGLSSASPEGHHMRRLMHHRRQRTLAAFVHECWQLRCDTPEDESVFFDCVSEEGSEYYDASEHFHDGD